MNKYFIVGILLLATAQSSIGFANSHCQNDNDGNDQKLCKLGQAYREEIANTQKNDISNSERRVALSRYHSGTENSRIYKERNSNKERSGNEARSFSAFFERSARRTDRQERENREYTRQIRNEQRRLLVSRARENENRRITERRQNSRRVSAESQMERRDYKEDSRDTRFRREFNNQERRDAPSSRRVEERRLNERRIDNSEVRERRNMPADRIARFVVEARRRETRGRTSEERRTDVRREEVRRSANGNRYVRNERADAENSRFNRASRLNILGQRVVREDREESRRLADKQRENVNRRYIRSERDSLSNRRTDATRRYVQNSGRDSTRRISNEIRTYEKPLTARSETRRDVQLARSRVENERFVGEKNRDDERTTRLVMNRGQNNVIKYEQGSYFTGFDIAKALCVAMVLAQMAVYGRGEKSKLSFGNMLPQVPSFTGWMKQKAD